MNKIFEFVKDDSSILKLLNQGIEREGLRVMYNGEISMTPHPKELGSKLSNPYITTDYSENLLEYVTPVFNRTGRMVSFLEDLHLFTYGYLESEEMIWPGSMPPKLPLNENDIPLADYGSSNVGKLKNLYRVGLSHRYGSSMQTIAGIHYNFSLDNTFWEAYKKWSNDSRPLREIVDEGYFNLIRNFKRTSWILSYLFGCSPVVDKSFLINKKHDFELLAKDSYGKKYATSLRMGGLGYTSEAQKKISICYNELNTYIKTLENARQESYPAYEKIKTKENGVYKQLNTNLIQIDR